MLFQVQQNENDIRVTTLLYSMFLEIELSFLVFNRIWPVKFMKKIVFRKFNFNTIFKAKLKVVWIFPLRIINMRYFNNWPWNRQEVASRVWREDVRRLSRRRYWRVTYWYVPSDWTRCSHWTTDLSIREHHLNLQKTTSNGHERRLDDQKMNRQICLEL